MAWFILSENSQMTFSIWIFNKYWYAELRGDPNKYFDINFITIRKRSQYNFKTCSKICIVFMIFWFDSSWLKIQKRFWSKPKIINTIKILEIVNCTIWNQSCTYSFDFIWVSMWSESFELIAILKFLLKIKLARNYKYNDYFGKYSKVL